ncbi:phosphoenolpyruvate--protein phosphotransferase [Pseudogracilibacillus sp. SE30717A]|uniref:phosphoenolpyruvate--protein phosphotransferase n=1 Tax=Pseudogracilibacillus sp. SE30717A TaxID=3098293 RepID=UPI00300E4ABD
MTNILTGISASKGIAIARPYLLKDPDLSYEAVEIDNVSSESAKLKSALEQAKIEILVIQDNLKQSGANEEAEIFAAHLMLLEDPELISAIEAKISEEKVNVEAAVDEVMQSYIIMFESMDDEYLKERAADIKDIRKRVLSHLLNKPLPDLSLIDDEVIIIAEDLTPSATAQLDVRYVKGFITDVGGRTSHSAIMARTMGIPAIVGTSNASQVIEADDMLIIDGSKAEVLINPETNVLKNYQSMLEEELRSKEFLLKYVDVPTKTTDHVNVNLSANIGSPLDLEAVVKNGAEGIGLYRTEFLYMGSKQAPTEDEQYEAYKKVLETMGNRPVTVRTLDIGGDKELSYLDLPKEMNPFLGLRAVRYTLQETELFRIQLRALLRASVHGHLKIMFPMISTFEEFHSAKQLLLEEKSNLKDEGIQVSDDIEIGIMVETPSVIMMADQFAKEVDFFSIGTNDLTQYTFACDRMNENVSYLYQSHHPAIFKMIEKVIQAAHREGKQVSVCGELASDTTAQIVLVGMGIDTLSMNASSILESRAFINGQSKSDLEKVVEKVKECTMENEVIELLNKHIDK